MRSIIETNRMLNLGITSVRFLLDYFDSVFTVCYYSLCFNSIHSSLSDPIRQYFPIPISPFPSLYYYYFYNKVILHAIFITLLLFVMLYWHTLILGIFLAPHKLHTSLQFFPISYLFSSPISVLFYFEICCPSW